MNWQQLHQWASDPTRTLAELQAAATGLGLTTTGSLTTLRNRVRNHAAAQVLTDPAPWTPLAPPVPPVPPVPAPAPPPPPGDEPWYRNRGNLAALGILAVIVLGIGLLWNSLNDGDDNGGTASPSTTLVDDDDPDDSADDDDKSGDDKSDDDESDGDDSDDENDDASSQDDDDDSDDEGNNDSDDDDSDEGNTKAGGNFPNPGNLDSMDKTVIEMAEEDTWFHRVFNERLFNEANDWGGADSWFVSLALGSHDGGNWTDHGNPGQIVYRGEETHLEWTLGLLTDSTYKEEFMGDANMPAAVNVRIAPNSPVTVVTASGQTVTQDTSDMGDITIILPDDGVVTISVDYSTAAPTHESLVWWGPYDRSDGINTIDAS